MLTEEELDRIERSVLCWLATSTDNHPSVSPKQIFTIHNERLLIANIASPNSAKNIKRNPSVCVGFLDVFTQKGLQLAGDAEVINRSDTRFEGLAAPLKQLAGDDFPFSSLFEVTPRATRPIIAPRYRLFPDTTESDQIADAMRAYRVRPAAPP